MPKNGPSFFVVGTQKAGTSTLHDRLNAEPGLCLPSIKETHFFSNHRRFAKGLDWYQQWFQCDEWAIRGEVCPEYMFFKEAPYRISRVVPNPIFVFIFREPIDRAYSHYRMTKRRGHEELGFAKALEAEAKRLADRENLFAMIHYSYMARGRYTEQVERFKKVFPDAKYLFLTFDELIDPDKKTITYGRICDHLGIKSIIKENILDKRSNPASVPKSTVVRDLLYGDSRLRRLIRPIVRTLLFNENLRLKMAMAVDRLNLSSSVQPETDERALVPNEFRQAALAEADKLAALTGVDLSVWRDRPICDASTEESV